MLRSRCGAPRRSSRRSDGVNEIDNTIRIQTAETVAGVRSELKERSGSLESPISLFDELGSEIYTDKVASLLIPPTAK
jgi:hypothetical protein